MMRAARRCLEVVRPEILDEAVPAEHVNHAFAGCVIIAPTRHRQFASLQRVLLVSQESLA
jgi:hypothetical protein